MGYAVAHAAAEAGARVVLISGPTHLPDVARVRMVRVSSAQQMHDAVKAHIDGAHIFIGVAAVSDYRPERIAPAKIKKDAASLTLELVKNPDIVADVAARRAGIYTVGFAAETDHLEENARAKLEAKNLDMVAANRVGVAGSGFEADENSLLLIDRDGVAELPRANKAQLARALIHEIALRYHAKKNRAQDTRQAHR